MIKRLQYFWLICVIFFLPLLSFGQQLDRIQGELLFQLEGESIQDLQESLEVDYSQIFSIDDFEIISMSFNVWKLNFDHNLINELELLSDLKTIPFVENAQFNYFVSDRSIPDDPYFPSLWHLKNTGQSGGTPGADLSVTEAWELTTGGVSYTGDTVVICIIDGTFDYDHEDLLDNVWVNYDEISDDTIDNDNNGYVDDYWGWNVDTENDNIENWGASDWHGTAVTGIAGAVTDNETGIAGVAWNIKLMLVSRGSTIADAVAAYSYPFKNRQIYNQTQGQKGAYVVATNSSWGLDFGTPDDAPLWCAMYDSLGSVGILNVAATTNNNVDVDIVGDLPTNCISNYLITCTSLNHFDIKTENAGYGAQSIDLGAFGKNVWSTINNDNYYFLNGTSMAAPQITAAIGLLHTSPCPSFSVFAKTNPQQAALQLKSYILNGVDSNASLEGITVTGGRMNIKKSLDLLMDNCDFSGCFAPYLVSINSVYTTSASISWLTDIATDQVNLRYKKVNAMNWIPVNNVQAPFSFSGLEDCTFYEFQLQSVCNNSSSSFTASFTFKTDGCCTAPENISVIVSDNAFDINWDPVTAALTYNFRYRQTGTTLWETINVPSNYIQLNNLSSCQEYEFNISTICPNTQSSYSATQVYTTFGCGACLDLDYCEAYGPAYSLSWISQVSIANLNHSSVFPDNGYSDFTDQSANVIQGFVHNFELESDAVFFQFPAFFNIWIDFDQNGFFDENELAYQSSYPVTNASGIIYIPNSALLGNTRMRVGFLEEGQGACDPIGLIGEMEDYCINIAQPTECVPPVNISFETTETIAYLNWTGNILINEYLLKYRETGMTNWNTVTTVANNFTLYNLLPCTDYEFFLTSNCDGETSPSSATFDFTTKGCGSCLDYQYCQTIPCNIDFEWIEKVTFNDFENPSGPNGGYMHFPEFSTNVNSGNYYTLTLEPGFSNEVYDERFYAWIDFDQDGNFSSSEKVLDEFSENGETISKNILIPIGTPPGSTRMRISMKYANPIFYACDSGFFGEIEEYCINIFDQTGSISCPVPEWLDFIGIDSFTVNLNWQIIPEAVSYKLRYRPLNATSLPWQYITTGNNEVTLSNLMACEDYTIQIQTICDFGLSNFYELGFFNTCELVSTAEQDFHKLPEIYIYPNPFSSTTGLFYHSDQAANLKVQLYSNLGYQIDTFFFQANPGENSFEISLSDAPSGVYYLTLMDSDHFVVTKKIVHIGN